MHDGVTMANGTGEDFREAFEEHLEVFGEDFHIAGETKRGVFSDEKGSVKISFLPAEFAVKMGDVVPRWATEEKFSVVSAKVEAIAGVIVSFEVIVVPRS